MTNSSTAPVIRLRKAASPDWSHSISGRFRSPTSSRGRLFVRSPSTNAIIFPMSALTSGVAGSRPLGAWTGRQSVPQEAHNPFPSPFCAWVPKRTSLPPLHAPADAVSVAAEPAVVREAQLQLGVRHSARQPTFRHCNSVIQSQLASTCAESAWLNF